MRRVCSSGQWIYGKGAACCVCLTVSWARTVEEEEEPSANAPDRTRISGIHEPMASGACAEIWSYSSTS
jgi:hypothetical protein